MKRFLTFSLALLAVQLALTACKPASSIPRGTNYFCQQEGSVPATIAQTTRGDIPVIYWKSKYFKKWTPEARCKEVSDRFQTFYQTGLLRYLKADTMNGEPVICVTRTKNGVCSGLLITLERGDDPKKVLDDLIDPSVRSIDRGGESGDSIELIEELRSPN